MNTNQIQRMCYIVCYNSIRTRGVLAIPTPVRYADLCAYRAKIHVEAQRELASYVDDLKKSEEIETYIIASLNEHVKIDECLRNKLYYC